MPKHAVPALAFASLVVACTAGQPAPLPPEEPRPTPAAPSSTLPAHPAGELEFADAPAGPGIGSPCATASLCGKSGKVAVVHETIHGGRPGLAGPCTPVTTSAKQTMDATGACVAGDRIYAAKRCVVCRVTNEEHMLGLVADMTSEQLLKAQLLAGLPMSPLLTTTAAWSSAIMSAKQPQQWF